MWGLLFVFNWLFLLIDRLGSSLLKNGLGSSLFFPLKIIVVLEMKFGNRINKGLKGLTDRIILIIRINLHVKCLNDSVSKPGVSLRFPPKMSYLLNLLGYGLFILSIWLFKSLFFLKNLKLFSLLVFLLLVILLRVNFGCVRPVYYWVYYDNEANVLFWLTKRLELTFLLGKFIEYVNLV